MAKKDCILIADDAAIDRRIVRMLLRRDYDVEEAADGLEAVKHMEAHPDGYACILLDMLMPVMDGFKVMEYMQQHGLLEKIPVVALTAISDAEGHIKCYESGAIDIIEKPFDNRMLQYKLKFNINRFRRLRGLQGSVTAPSAPVSDASAAQTAVRPSLLDAIRSHLKATLDVPDEEMPDLIQTFMDSFTECADTLKGLGTSPDYTVIRGVTHKIYGFAQSIGAMELNDASLLLNAAAKQQDPDACAAGIRLILKIYGDCLAAAKRG